MGRAFTCTRYSIPIHNILINTRFTFITHSIRTLWINYAKIEMNLCAGNVGQLYVQQQQQYQ